MQNYYRKGYYRSGYGNCKYGKGDLCGVPLPYFLQELTCCKWRRYPHHDAICYFVFKS
nr:MAG TPA: NS1-linked peptide [Caudoviricetes sp.]